MISKIKHLCSVIAAKWRLVEAKVKAAGLGALFISFVVALLNDLKTHAELLAPLPPTLQFVVLSAIGPLVTFLVAYRAPHSDRPDLDD